MSANTSILEGGNARFFGPVTCLMVQGDDGKYYPWYPEADRQLDSLSVDKNGIYQASKYGVYGWNRVSVNVPQTSSVTGKDPQTGQEMTVTSDPETGELVETVVPVEIRIETPPTFTGPYGDGAYIDFSGLTVAAYDANGDKMQDVPFGQLIFPVTVTRYDPDADATYEATGGHLPQFGISAIPMFQGSVVLTNQQGDILEIDCHLPTFAYAYRNIDVLYLISAATEPQRLAYTTRVNGFVNDIYTTTAATEYDGKKAYQAGAGGYSDWPVSTAQISKPYTEVNPRQGNMNELAWSMLYGTVVQTGGTAIPVQWQRSGDGAILETAFYVSVINISPNNNSGN